MSTALLVFAVFTGIAVIIREYYLGRSRLKWAERCDPKNPAYRPPLEPPPRP